MWYLSATCRFKGVDAEVNDERGDNSVKMVSRETLKGRT